MAKTKSGKYWVAWANAHAVNSTRVADLSLPFRENVKEFIEALEAAGARVKVNSTKRDFRRAYLFHWAWKIALGKCRPSEATPITGVDIEWDHGVLAKSRAGAREMVDGFGLAVPPRSTVAPSLTSNHISGKAIDMTITWTGDLAILGKDGTLIRVPQMSSVNLNTQLQELGESYGVMKHRTDEPHWSHDGK